MELCVCRRVWRANIHQERFSLFPRVAQGWRIAILLIRVQGHIFYMIRQKNLSRQTSSRFTKWQLDYNGKTCKAPLSFNNLAQRRTKQNMIRHQWLSRKFKYRSYSLHSCQSVTFPRLLSRQFCHFCRDTSFLRQATT